MGYVANAMARYTIIFYETAWAASGSAGRDRCPSVLGERYLWSSAAAARDYFGVRARYDPSTMCEINKAQEAFSVYDGVTAPVQVVRLRRLVGIFQLRISWPGAVFKFGVFNRYKPRGSGRQQMRGLRRYLAAYFVAGSPCRQPPTKPHLRRR